MKIEDRSLGMGDKHHRKPLSALPDEELYKVSDGSEHDSRFFSETIHKLFL